MKVLAIVLLATIASASSLPEYVQDGLRVSNAKKQLQVLHLLFKVTEPIRERFDEVKDASINYKPLDHLRHYKDGGEAVQTLMKEIDDDRLLEQKHWFSLFNDRHREEAILFFNVLINSRDWHTFINSASYFRERINEGEFVYAFSTAVLHSELSQGLVLPPLYEITPHMFTNSEIISKAYTAKMTQQEGHFHMNFTGSKNNPEQRVAYFGEDIGMNLHHVSWHMNFPFWWDDSKYEHSLDRKGELFFWAHHQLTVRYDAERLSNYLNPVEELSWDKAIVEGFAPHTAYKYGGEFPTRPDNLYFEDVDGIVNIRDVRAYEDRIRDAIAHGYIEKIDGSHVDIRNDKGIQLLGEILESSKNSINPKYYGSLHNLAHIILGEQGDPHAKYNLPPGVMEHFETATRDPAFFRLHKYIDQIFKEHKDSLPPYTRDDVSFDVSIKSVGVEGKFETYFEDFNFNIEMAVDDTEQIKDVPISAIVKRINHEPFSLKFDVTNNRGQDVISTFRVYLCPRNDANGVQFSFNEGRWGCVELDKFWKVLSPGNHKVVRKSEHASTTTSDSLSYRKLLLKAEKAHLDNEEFPELERSCGFPNRFLLPKGTPEGLEFNLFVAVTDGAKDSAVEGLDKHVHRSHAQCGHHGQKYPDNRPLGYPLDRNVPDERILLELPNLKSTVVTVTHRQH